MPKPIKRRDLIRRLRDLGWTGPEAGGSHEVMRKEGRRLALPNPHRGDIDWSLTKRLLAQTGITPEDWARSE